MSAHPSPEQLSAFLDRELPDAVLASVEEHLRACDACAAHLAELASVDEAARALPFEEPAGYFDDFAARVRERVTARPARRLLVPTWGWAAAAAVLLAVVTPLALRERAAQSTAPAVMQDQAARPAAPAPEAAPDASASKQRSVPAAEPARAGEAERAPGASRGNQVPPDDRLLRRDQPADVAPQVELQASQDKREAQAPPQGAPQPPARLEEKTVDRMRTFDDTVPPVTSQRVHGPRVQQQYAPPPADMPKPAAAPAASEPVADADAAEGRVDGLADVELAKEKDDRASRQKRAQTFEGGAAGGAGQDVRLGATASAMKAAPAPAGTGDEARGQREAFRRMARENPDGPAADESRVGTIEAGVRAFLLERRAEDRATAERDGRAYLARPDALQKPRVRALLKRLSEARS